MVIPNVLVTHSVRVVQSLLLTDYHTDGHTQTQSKYHHNLCPWMWQVVRVKYLQATTEYTKLAITTMCNAHIQL